MENNISIQKSLVSVNWLKENFNAANLVILDATMKKVTSNDESGLQLKEQIQTARFFDIKNAFSDTSARFPNTIPSSESFTKAARLLGINSNSAIVVYDDLGVYSSPRAWWLFKAMGHTNVAVLDGGLPAWKAAELPLEEVKMFDGKRGNFESNYKEGYINDYKDVLSAIDDSTVKILDARSVDRFKGTTPEPREGLRSGHIPNSLNLPYTMILEDYKMRGKKELTATFSKLVKDDSKLIFSCGSGITACILALGAEIAGLKQLSVYDGSWTEWGSLTELPIEKV